MQCKVFRSFTAQHPVQQTILSALLSLACIGLTAHAQQQDIQTRATENTGVTLGIPRAQTTPAIDGKIDPQEWRDAFAITGVVNQFDVLLSPRQSTFWLKYDDDHLYLAVRSDTAVHAFDEAFKPVMPPLWLDQGDDSIIVALAPQESLLPALPTFEPTEKQQEAIAKGKMDPVPTYTPSHAFMRLNPLDQQRLMRFVSQIDGVAWRYPHQQQKIANLQRGSAYNSHTRMWTVEYVIPLASLGIKGQVDHTHWGMLLGRDYPQGNQNAISISNDWRFGIWSPNKEHAIDFWNFYQDKKDYAPAAFLGHAPAVQLLELGDVLTGELTPRMSLFNPADKPVSLTIQWNALGAYGLGPQVNQTQTINLKPGQQRDVTLEPVMLESEIVVNLKLTVTDDKGRVLFAQKLPALAGYGQKDIEPELPELMFQGAYKNANRHNLRAFMPAYDPIAERFWANVEVPLGSTNPDDIDTIKKIAGLDLIIRQRGQTTPLATISLNIDTNATFPISHAQGYRVHDSKGQHAGEYHPTRLHSGRTRIIPGEFRVQTDAPKLKPGVYELTARLIDTQGKPIAQSHRYFIRHDHKKDLPWLGNQLGLGDEILPPWTPIQSNLQADKSELSVWGRRYDLNAGALIQNVNVLDENLLASPMQIQIKRGETWDTLAPQGKLNILSDKPNETRLQGQLAGSGFKASTDSRLEYDGYLAFKITLSPDTQKNVDALRLRVPIHSRFATTLHATGGTYMRASSSILNFENKQGQLWNSNQARSGGSHRIPYTVGSFMPYVWVGGVERGLAFMANNDKGWVPYPQKNERVNGVPTYLNELVPSIEVVRENDTTYLVLNIVQRPFEFDKPRTIEFSLQATPIRPLPDDFRARIMRLNIGIPFTGWTDIWDNNGMRLKMDGLSVRGHGAGLAPLSWDRHENRKRRKDEYFHAYQAMDGTLPYAELDQSVIPGLQGANINGYLNAHNAAGQYSPGQENMTQAEIDYRMWRYDQWLARGKALDGFYYDNTFARLSSNLGTGSGYIIDIHDDPEVHGSIQPGYAVTAIRQFTRRLRSLFLKHRGESHIWLHSTDAQMISAYAFADYLMPGENAPHLNKGGVSISTEKITTNKDHMQMYHNPRKWGLATNHLSMWGTGWDGWHHDPQTVKGFREMFSWLQLHDTSPAGYHQKVDWRGLDLTRAADFQPYWDPKVQKAIRSNDPEVYVSGWVQDGAIRMLAFSRNDDKRKVTVEVEPALLGINEPQEGWQAVFLDANEKRTYIHGKNTELLNMPWPGEVTSQVNVQGSKIVFTFEVNARDSRLLMVHPKGQPIPFPQGGQTFEIPSKVQPKS